MKIIRDSFVYLLGDLLSKSVPFLLLPYLGRILGSSGFGELSYYQVIIALGLIFISFSQDGAIIRYYYKHGKHLINQLVIVSISHAVFFLVLLIAASLFLNDILITYALITAFTQSVLAIVLAIQQCQRQSYKYIAIQLTNALLSGGLTVAFFHMLSASVENRILSMMIANATSVGLSIAFFGLCGKTSVIFNWKRFKLLYKYIFSFGLPLLLHQTSFFIKGQVDRVLIYQCFSSSILGVYSAGYQIASILAIVLMALNKATLPYYYECIKSGKIGIKKVKKYLLYSCLIIPIPGLVAWVLPQALYVWVLGSQFVDVKYYVVIFSLAISLTIPYLLLVNYLFYHGANGIISRCTVGSSLVYIVLVFVFARVDIVYVPLAMVISNLLLIIILYWTARKCVFTPR